MMLKVQQLELKRDSKVNAIVDREAKKSPFMKLMKYNQPKINIVLGILVSIV